MQTPILFLVFNRPDVTKRAFESIRNAKPPRLYIASDGPRNDNPNDIQLCKKVREIFDDIDWSCELKTLYRDENLGCRLAVSTAIDWFFENEEDGIILEDDCLPDDSFYKFCEEMLEKYRDDNRIMSITGDNFQYGQIRNKFSYYFSRYIHCWGWATWRRAWKYYDNEMTLWPVIRENNILKHILNDNRTVNYWTNIFNLTYSGEIDSWAYRWTLSCWCQSGLTIIPNINLVSNIGFGEDATHTISANHLSNIKTKSMRFPLRHPEYVVRDTVADAFTQKYSINTPPLYKRIIRKFTNIIK